MLLMATNLLRNFEMVAIIAAELLSFTGLRRQSDFDFGECGLRLGFFTQGCASAMFKQV